MYQKRGILYSNEGICIQTGTPWGLTHLPASPDGEFEETPTTNNVSTVLATYGYGNPACDVYRFWESHFPITTTGANVLTLVVHCPPGLAGLGD